MDKKQALVLALVVVASAVALLFFKPISYSPAKCELTVEPGSNVSQVSSSEFSFNITYSLLNASLHLVTLRVKGVCWWSITPVLDVRNLRYKDLRLVFIVNNQSTTIRLPEEASLFKAETIEIGPNMTIHVYLRGTIIYGTGSIKLIIQEVSK